MGKLSLGSKICALFLIWGAAAIGLPAQTEPVMAPPTTTFTLLHSFHGADGETPGSTLVQGTDGAFYGTTNLGGANDDGTVFTITAGGTLSTLYSFDGADGADPVGGLIQGTDGAFYGTTERGGAYNYGTVFSITAGGTLTTLHSFNYTVDGAALVAGLVEGTNGTFYGTTPFGGSGCGTVFSITAGGGLTTIYSFDCTDGGAFPESGLVQGTNGKLYGTTSEGGANPDCGFPYACGTVFSITTGGAVTTLYSFDSTDGYGPIAGLVQGANGEFYGSTSQGANDTCYNGCGTVFSITADGALTTLYSFDGTDGWFSRAGLVQGADGKLYGTTYFGGGNCGSNGCGTVFSITTGGTLTTLHNFDRADGSEPSAGLVQGTNGIFYGTTRRGGANDEGTVFAVSVGLGPFVKLLPARGPVGSTVNVLGSNLTGTTNVTFNGVEAAFTVVSQYSITATVPSGAMTGKVEVMGPQGILKSNVAFHVSP